MLRKSVLSAVREDSAKLQKRLGSADRARLDQYFTSLRSLEQRLALQLQKPEPTAACHIPGAPQTEVATGMDVELVTDRHKLMADILVAALACNQTRVFNMGYSESAATTIKKGISSAHYAITHEEVANEHGYQEMHSWFHRKSLVFLTNHVGLPALIICTLYRTGSRICTRPSCYSVSQRVCHSSDDRHHHGRAESPLEHEPLVFPQRDLGETDENECRGRKRAERKAGRHMTEDGRAANGERILSDSACSLSENRQHAVIIGIRSKDET